MNVLTATSVLDSQIIADLAFLAIDRNPPALKENLIIGSMLTGFVSMMIWRFMDLGDVLYEAGIGIPCAMIYYMIWRILFKKNLAKNHFKK